MKLKTARRKSDIFLVLRRISWSPRKKWKVAVLFEAVALATIAHLWKTFHLKLETLDSWTGSFCAHWSSIRIARDPIWFCHTFVLESETCNVGSANVKALCSYFVFIKSNDHCINNGPWEMELEHGTNDSLSSVACIRLLTLICHGWLNINNEWHPSSDLVSHRLLRVSLPSWSLCLADKAWNIDKMSSWLSGQFGCSHCMISSVHQSVAVASSLRLEQQKKINHSNRNVGMLQPCVCQSHHVFPKKWKHLSPSGSSLLRRFSSALYTSEFFILWMVENVQTHCS